MNIIMNKTKPRIGVRNPGATTGLDPALGTFVLGSYHWHEVVSGSVDAILADDQVSMHDVICVRQLPILVIFLLVEVDGFEFILANKLHNIYIRLISDSLFPELLLQILLNFRSECLPGFRLFCSHQHDPHIIVSQVVKVFASALGKLEGFQGVAHDDDFLGFEELIMKLCMREPILNIMHVRKVLAQLIP